MGELARQPGCPELAKTPLELLTPRPGEGFSTFQKLIWPYTGILIGIVSAAIRNKSLRRPIYASAPIYALYAGGLAYGACLIRDYLFTERAENDAILKHYITLHPEDFPPFERKRYADIYIPFKPVR